MNRIKEISEILKTEKWDYAKFVQVTSKFGGPKKAVLKFGSLSALAGSLFTLLGSVLGARLLKKTESLSNNIKMKNKKISPEDQDTINSRTQIYLDKRERMINAGEDVTSLDKEYNDFMTKYYG